MKYISKIAIFVAGVAVGGGAMHFYTRDKVEKEIEDARQLYLKRAKQFKEELEKKETEEPESDSEENTAEIKAAYVNYAEKYTGGSEPVSVEYSNIYAKPPVDQVVKQAILDTKPDSYLISEDEYTYDEQNSKMSLTRYSDGTIADSFTDAVMIQHDVLNQIGIDLVSELDGDLEEIFVRNPVLGIDFDILKDERTYTEVAGR